MVKAHFEEELRQKIIINRSPFKTRRKLPHITFFGQVPNLKDFMLEKVPFVLFLGKVRYAEEPIGGAIDTHVDYQWLQQSHQ